MCFCLIVSRDDLVASKFGEALVMGARSSHDVGEFRVLLFLCQISNFVGRATVAARENDHDDAAQSTRSTCLHLNDDLILVGHFEIWRQATSVLR
jgi:Na+-translocating ferredoxin:NAD+ oxidoreductase RnfE subunit